VMTTTTTSKGCCYDQCEPVSRVVEFIKSRYAEGHYIIIMSDRGVKEAKGNSYLANRLHAETSLRQLRANGIAYHEIWLGKPYADFYIDDKAILYVSVIIAMGCTVGICIGLFECSSPLLINELYLIISIVVVVVMLFVL